MPDELRDARLVMNESDHEAPGPHPLRARLDQVFVTRAGVAILVESKTRNDPRARRADQVQLSAQRAVLERTRPAPLRGAELAAYGYIRVVGDKGVPQYRRVALLPTEAVDALQARDQALRRGEEPWFADDPSRCRRCRTTDQCPAWTARHSRPLSTWWPPAQRRLLQALEVARPGFVPLLRAAGPSRGAPSTPPSSRGRSSGQRRGP